MPASQDRLLKSTTVAIKGIFVLISAFIAIALIVLPALILVPEGAGIIGAYKHVNREVVVSLTEVSLAEGVVFAVLLLLILRRLRRIVDSAIISDPFVPANALLLRQIGWLVLAINSAQIIFNLAKRLVLAGSEIQPGFNPLNIPWLGFFATLLIFVLARVFQRGSDMRADLEGTV
jgi:Protein of unknown function (DUF2975)